MDKEIQQLADEQDLEPPTIAELDAMVDFLGGIHKEPDPDDGWFTIVDMMKATGRSYNYVYYRLKTAYSAGEMDRMKYMRFAYYRLKRNGNDST